MKKSINWMVAVVAVVMLPSCGVNYAYVYNHNANNTQVNLGSKNFEVLGRASGDSEVSYVLLFGGARKRKMYQDAYAEMIENANLTSGSKAVTNIVTEEHVGGFAPFYFTRTITVSASVIEFTK